MACLKKNISLTLLLFISFIFAYKYIYRITDYAFLLSTTIVFLQFLAFKLEGRINITTKTTSAAYFAFIALLLVLVTLVTIKIPVESLNVDRYSIINSFIEQALQGNYPYYAKSVEGNNPGPMPFYFLIAFPFYLIGELSLLSFIGYGIFLYATKKKIKNHLHVNFFLFYFVSSLYVYWEIAVRSNIFTISVFILFLMDYYLRISHHNKLKLYLFAFVAGLFLSTRSVYIIVYMVFFLSDLINKKIKFSQLIFFGLFGFLGFSLTFLPLLLFFKNDFLVMNPFIIQSSSLIPQNFIYPFLTISLLLTLTIKTNLDKFFISGVSLFISILIYALYEIYKSGIQQGIYGNSIDISYFLLCVPFLAFYLISVKSKSCTEII